MLILVVICFARRAYTHTKILITILHSFLKGVIMKYDCD